MKSHYTFTIWGRKFNFQFLFQSFCLVVFSLWNINKSEKGNVSAWHVTIPRFLQALSTFWLCDTADLRLTLWEHMLQMSEYMSVWDPRPFAMLLMKAKCKHSPYIFGDLLWKDINFLQLLQHYSFFQMEILVDLLYFCSILVYWADMFIFQSYHWKSSHNMAW